MHRIRLWVLLLGGIMGCAAGGHPGATSRSTDSHLLLNKTWQWEATMTPAETISVSDPDRYTIRFLADGQLQARFDCNRGGGSYTISAGKLSFGPMMSTRMACLPDSQDGPFMRDLQRVTSFFVEEGTLYLELPYDSGTMHFREAPTSKQPDTPVGDILKFRGTVVHTDVEGGFFAIESDDGRVYDPINLPDRFKKHGLKVNVASKLRNDMGSIHMVGDIIEIVEIDAE